MTKRLLLITLTALGLGLLAMRYAKRQRDALNAAIDRVQVMCPDEVDPLFIPGAYDYHAVAPGVEDAYKGFDFDPAPPFSFNSVEGRAVFDQDLADLREKGSPIPGSVEAFRRFFEEER